MRLHHVLLVSIAAFSLAASATSEPHPRHYRRVAVVDVDVAPPPPRVIVVPAARRGYVWAPGYWRWNGRQHVWIDGRWMRERRGVQWVPAHWEQRGNRWHFEDGHWER